VREENPDLLYAFDGTPNLASLIPKLINPKLKVVWGIRCSAMDLTRYDWVVRPLSAMTSGLSGFADALIANSSSGFKHFISQGYPQHKMVVIPNGVDTERFRPDQETRRRVRAEWGIAEHETLVGLVARLDPMKDHATFLRAAAHVATQSKGVRFVCVGEGPEAFRTSLKNMASRLDLDRHLLWAGARSDMTAVHNACDLAVNSSAYGEGVSNAISEAMACGIPCVVTDVGDSSWVVGSFGQVVPPQDWEALAAGILTVLGQHSRDCEGIRHRIIKELSISNLLSRTEHVLHALLQQSTPNLADYGSATSS
jgi:glycosyltransferase involved in cell wall biosynthesis